MASHNIDLHAVDTMLQNTLQLHRQLNRSQSGVTRTPNNPRQQQQPTNPSCLGMGSSLRIESGSRSAYHSGSISTSAQPMDRSFSESSSNSMGSSGPATVVASPPQSSAPGRASHTTSPSSPITSAFSSPQIPRLPSSATFASYNDHPQRQDPQPTSALSGITPPKDLPVLSVDTAALPPSTSAITPSVTPYTRSYTKSLSAGTHPHSSPSAQPHTRRIKTSLGGTANIDHNGRLVHHLLAGHDSKDGAASIFVNVRDVAKDLWVRLEIPRNIPVQSARDLILAKCQRTMAPPSAPSSVAETLQVDDESSVPQKQGGRSEQSSEQRSNELNVNELDQDPSKTPTHRSKGNNKSVAYNNIPNTHSNRSTTKSSHSNNSNRSDHHSHGSLDEEDIQLRAEAIITRLDLFVDSINGFGDSAARINYIRPIQVKSQNSTSHNEGQSEPTKSQNLRRLLSNSSMNHDDHSTSPPERQNREGGAGRLGQIPGWSHWRERHNSHTGKTDVHDLGDVLIDYPAEGQDYPNEAIQKDCEAWKASFGLFWVAAGHWLDDSRLINSYHLQPQDVLELQRRDHYIQLPPPGSNLSYYDHYAEGVLFKLSKKNRPVSMFSNNGNKESTGVWKERWVVLQGSRLLIYHKRKDVSKKTIDLPSPLNVLSRVLPQSSRQMFKFTPSATAMSSTMIAIDVSTDPMDPKLCFRGSSEHDINHWIRIFNSLNSNAAPLASPMPHGGPGSPMTAGSDMGSLSSAIASFSPERRRVQTTNTAFSNDAATVPSINPVLILNAAAAISNLHNMQSNLANINNSNNSNGNHNHYRNLSQANHLQGVPTLDNKELNLLHHHPLNIAAKEDIRRRAITEPNRHRLMNAQQQRGHMKQSSKVSAPEIDTRAAGPVDVSNVSEAPFRLDSPPGRKRRPVLGTEYLDNASQVLLATSSARSSTAPVYSGYVWLYIPQATEPREKTSKDLQPNSSPDSSKLPSPGSPKSYASSSSKASGRYVKCFAAINDQGHFQWVEVKKQNDLGQEHDVKADIRSSSRSSYGIQLAPSQKQTPNCRPADGTALEDAEMAPHADSATTKKSRELIQASMSHKLRLFFFCIKISPSALREVFIDMVPDTPSPSASPPAVVSPETTPTATPATSGAAKVANRVRHRLSSSLSTLTTAAKPPLPNVKSQSLSGSISKGKNATWPTMAPSHDRDASLHPGLSSNNRPMSHKASSSSLKSTLSNITTVPSPAWLQSKEGDGQLVQSPASAGSADPESPSSSTSSSSHVLSLAQGLQKAVRMTRSNSGSGSLDGLGRLPGYEADAYISRSAGSSPNSSGTRPKMTLSEVMAAKQASIPDSAATLEQSKLLQQQIELQQGQQRADERLARSMAHNHNYQPLQEAVNLEPKPTSESIRATCPFLELNKDSDDMDSDEPMVTLKGYTETEEGWKILQWALEKFLDGPIQDHNSALPPDDTLIPSYHSPPEIRLSEKANMFLSAKASLIDEANLAASMAAVDAVRSPTPDISMTRHDSGLPSTTITYSSNSSAAMSASSSSATTATSSTMTTNGTSSSSSSGPVAQIRATSVSLTRWMNLSGGGGDRDKNKKGASVHRASPSVSAASPHAVIALPPAPDQQRTNNNKQAYNMTLDVPSSQSSSIANNNSNKSGSATATAGGGTSKRGITPANVLSLSVGSGTSLFRPRPRLNQQRSADELSKMLQLGHSRTESGSNGLFQVYENDLSGHYTTSTAMMYPTDHSTEELMNSAATGSSNNNNNSSSSNSSSTATTMPRSKGRSYCVDKDHSSSSLNSLPPPPPLPPSSSSSRSVGVVRSPSQKRSKRSSSVSNSITPPNSNGRSTHGYVTTISAAAAAAAAAVAASGVTSSTSVLSPSLSSSSTSPPSSTSSSSASLSYKSSQAITMSTGGGGGGGVGGALHEIQEGSEKVVFHVQESDHRSSVMMSKATTDHHQQQYQQQQKLPPPLSVRPTVAEMPTSSKDRTHRSSLSSLCESGPEFWAVVEISGCGGGSGGGRSGEKGQEVNGRSGKSNDNGNCHGNSNGISKDKNVDSDGMLQLTEIGCDLGLSLSEFENPDGTLRTDFFSFDNNRLQQQEQRQAQRQEQQHKLFAPRSTTLPASSTSFSSSLSTSAHPLDLSVQQQQQCQQQQPPMMGLRAGDEFGDRRAGNGRGMVVEGASGGNGGGEGSSAGINNSSNNANSNKKHHTVLGAGRAAVTGVFGKFRKSVG